MPVLVFDKNICMKEDGTPRFKIRPLRCMTAKGPRVSIAKSERVPKGSKLDFVLTVLNDSPMTESALRTLLNYGETKGLGQWRNSGCGRFTYTMTKVG